MTEYFFPPIFIKIVHKFSSLFLITKVSTELFPSNVCFTVACLDNCYLAEGLGHKTNI
jgi:hypothetical protein